MERRASEKGEKEKGNVSARRSFSLLQEVFTVRIHFLSFASSILATRSRISKPDLKDLIDLRRANPPTR
jgi:hypothetical protein